MSNLALALKSEIARLAKKEAKSHVAPLRRSSNHHRREIAALKRELVSIKKQLAVAFKGERHVRAVAEDDGRPLRFQARGLIAERARLGLSQKDFGRLVGVSSQTVLSWEQRKSVPRRSQLLALAAVRGIGKREAAERLAP